MFTYSVKPIWMSDPFNIEFISKIEIKFYFLVNEFIKNNSVINSINFILLAIFKVK